MVEPDNEYGIEAVDYEDLEGFDDTSLGVDVMLSSVELNMAKDTLEGSIVVSRESMALELDNDFIVQSQMDSDGMPAITVTLGDYDDSSEGVFDVLEDLIAAYPASNDIQYNFAEGDELPYSVTLRIGSKVMDGMLDLLEELGNVI